MNGRAFSQNHRKRGKIKPPPPPNTLQQTKNQTDTRICYWTVALFVALRFQVTLNNWPVLGSSFYALRHNVILFRSPATLHSKRVISQSAMDLFLSPLAGQHRVDSSCPNPTLCVNPGRQWGVCGCGRGRGGGEGPERASERGLTEVMKYLDDDPDLIIPHPAGP